MRNSAEQTAGGMQEAVMPADVMREAVMLADVMLAVMLADAMLADATREAETLADATREAETLADATPAPADGAMHSREWGRAPRQRARAIAERRAGGAAGRRRVRLNARQAQRHARVPVVRAQVAERAGAGVEAAGDERNDDGRESILCLGDASLPCDRLSACSVVDAGGER